MPLERTNRSWANSDEMSPGHEAIVLQAENIKKRYGMIAFISSWLIHASYIVLPGTFTSLGQRLDQNDNGRLVVAPIKNVPLLPLAVICLRLWQYRTRICVAEVWRQLYMDETKCDFVSACPVAPIAILTKPVKSGSG